MKNDSEDIYNIIKHFYFKLMLFFELCINQRVLEKYIMVPKNQAHNCFQHW